MTTLHDGLTWGELVRPGDRWRLVLKFSALEYAVDLVNWERFPERVARWWPATNGTGVIVVSAPEMKPDGKVAVIDIGISQSAPIPTVRELVSVLDDLVPAVRLSDVYRRPNGTSAELAAGRLALLEASDDSLVERIGDAVKDGAGAVVRPVLDVLILAGGLLLFAFVLGKVKK